MTKIALEIGDPQILSIVDATSELELLESGFGYAEGPVWIDSRGSLIFSDIPNSKIFEWSELQGLSVYREPSNMANGNFLDQEGRLITCEHATSRVVREEHDGTIITLSSHFNGAELNSPNDIVEHSDGTIFFTDPTYGRLPGAGVPRPIPQPHRGVYRLEPSSGQLNCIAQDFVQPNGLCFSRDESCLFVNDSERFHIRVFYFDSLSQITDRGVWAETRGSGFGSPDGMKIDRNGFLFCCAQNGVQIFDPDARWLGTILTPEEAGNFAFGGDDRLTLFIAASSSLYSLRLWPSAD